MKNQTLKMQRRQLKRKPPTFIYLKRTNLSFVDFAKLHTREIFF